MLEQLELVDLARQRTLVLGRLGAARDACEQHVGWLREVRVRVRVGVRVS